MVVSRALRSCLVTWRVVALATPRVVRHCPRCGEARRFASSDRFRINANGRRLDVWLIYRCADCDATWNREVQARCRPEELQDNDRAAAWACAFDLPGLARLGARVDAEVPWRVDPAVVDPGEPGGGLAIRIELADPVALRLDRLLADRLGLSRRRLQEAWAGGGVVVRPAAGATLRRPVRDGQLVEVCPAIVGNLRNPAD